MRRLHPLLEAPDLAVNLITSSLLARRRRTDYSSQMPVKYGQLPNEFKRRLNRAALSSSHERDQAFYKVIRSIPKGRVSTYGKVAAAAGFPLYHRAVAKFLRGELSSSVPWQRVLGAGGEIKLRGDAAVEQRRRLRSEGVAFEGRRVKMATHEHVFKTWEMD
jgi:methylated-DNA-protein-cysteine methyltransferase related protein